MDKRHLDYIKDIKITITAKDGRELEITQTGDEIAKRIANFMYQTFTHAFSGPVSGPMRQLVLDGLNTGIYADIRKGLVKMESSFPTINTHYRDENKGLVYFNLDKTDPARKYDRAEYTFDTPEEAREVYDLAYELYNSLNKK